MTLRKAVQKDVKQLDDATIKLIRRNVEDAMRKVLAGRPRDDVRESCIPSLADKYVEMASNFLSSTPPPTKKKIQSQLSEIEGQATELLESLAGLEGPAVEAVHSAMKEGDHPPAKRVINYTGAMQFDSRPLAIGDIMGRLETLIDATRRAKIPHQAKDKHGPDRKVDALQIAKAAADDYPYLTGNAPERSRNKPAFPDFLAAIFKALNRRYDSVENLAKQAGQWWKKDRPREDAADLQKWLARVEE
jgi:hypothetical protein